MLAKSIRYSLFLSVALFVSGCFQVNLNGPVVGATVTIVPVNNPDQVVFIGKSSDVDATAPAKWEGMGPLARLVNLGRVTIEGEFKRNQYYLVTASGGRDADADLNKQVDEQFREVAGQWHALMTGRQLLQNGRNVSALTEAVYQTVSAELDSLDRKQLTQRLDDIAETLLDKDFSGDGRIGYEDVLRWNRILPDDGLVADEVDLNRLALAVQEDASTDELEILANRILSGPAAFGLDSKSTVNVVKRDPDGSCKGRGAAIASSGLESVTTLPPTTDCDKKDKGKVISSSRDAVVEIAPDTEGQPRKAEVDDASVKFQYTNNNQMRISFVLQEGDEERTTTRNNPSPEKLEKISNTYNRLLAASDAGDASSSAKSRSRASRAQDPVFSDSLADAITYGALVSNWVACAVHGLVTELEAQDEQVPESLRTWAIAGCTSVLSEVGTWIEETPAKAVEQFESGVPAVSLEGCTDCYSLIVSPRPPLSGAAGKPIEFNGVAPPNARQVRWSFGDGNFFEGTSIEYIYRTPGLYTASFDVVYADGSNDSSTVVLDLIPPESRCLDNPLASAGLDRTVDASSFVVLSGSGTAFAPPGCTIVAYQWSQVDTTGLGVSLENSGSYSTSFTAPAVSEPATLSFLLTVQDSNGGTASDLVDITVQPVSLPGCNLAPSVDASYRVDASGEVIFLDVEATPDGEQCGIASYDWEQTSGSPTVSLESNIVGEGDFGFYIPLELEEPTELSFAVTVTDSEGNSASDTVVVPLESYTPIYPKLYSTSFTGKIYLYAKDFPGGSTSCEVTLGIEVLLNEDGTLQMKYNGWRPLLNDEYVLTGCEAGGYRSATFGSEFTGFTIFFRLAFSIEGSGIRLIISEAQNEQTLGPGTIIVEWYPIPGQNYDMYLEPICEGPDCELP